MSTRLAAHMGTAARPVGGGAGRRDAVPAGCCPQRRTSGGTRGDRPCSRVAAAVHTAGAWRQGLRGAARRCASDAPNAHRQPVAAHRPAIAVAHRPTHALLQVKTCFFRWSDSACMRITHDGHTKVQLHRSVPFWHSQAIEIGCWFGLEGMTSGRLPPGRTAAPAGVLPTLTGPRTPIGFSSRRWASRFQGVRFPSHRRPPDTRTAAARPAARPLGLRRFPPCWWRMSLPCLGLSTWMRRG
jgi:hypothetical protein